MDISRVLENFRNNGFEASYFETKEEASAYLNEKIDGTTVGFGGSMTLNEMGLIDSLKTHNDVISHWSVPEGMTVSQVLDKAMRTDVYLTSANGASEKGELVNIDGTGNRVGSTLFGHNKVYFVLGINKFEENLDKAIYRARNVSAPPNAKRLGKNTPCAVKGDRCYDCNSPERICRGLVVHYRKMSSCDIEVVIIGEKLGF
ncbi:MAG: lactate utilization protein [Ruminococcaceae bacterium]|nr:lactate utilization protein [Oscillospiraceae bacterium]